MKITVESVSCRWNNKCNGPNKGLCLWVGSRVSKEESKKRKGQRGKGAVCVVPPRSFQTLAFVLSEMGVTESF